MKILYVSTLVPGAERLALEREITLLQRQIAQLSTVASISFLPDLTLEELPQALSHHAPDVLHVSAHGHDAGLWFARGRFEGDPPGRVRLTGKVLAAFLSEHRPKLILLNACDSYSTAEELRDEGLTAIGTTAPITDQAAISAGILFYERLLRGRSLQEAFSAMDALVKTMDDDACRVQLFVPANVKPSELVLHPVTRLVAKLSTGARVEPSQPVAVHIGVTACPPNTTQVIFFTDDPSFITNKNKLEEHLTEVVRDVPRRGEIWTETAWTPEGDCRIAACGISGDGATFSLSSQLCQALAEYARTSNPPKAYRALLDRALPLLSAQDGAGLADWERE